MNTKYGGIQVITIPSNGQWRLEGETTWYNSGFTLEGLPVGSVRIMYKELPGYYKPGTGSVYRISENKISRVVKSYSKLPDDYVEDNSTGNIKVITTPPSKWRLEDDTIWYNSGHTLKGIPVGYTRIMYKELPGYYDPSSSSYKISKNKTIIVVKSYAKLPDDYVDPDEGEKEKVINIPDPEIVDPDQKEKNMIKILYSTIGRGPEIGTKISDIDQGGFDYWLGLAKQGMTYSTLLKHFDYIIKDYLKNNPDTPYAIYIKKNSDKY